MSYPRIPQPTRDFILEEAKKTHDRRGFYRWMIRVWRAGR